MDALRNLWLRLARRWRRDAPSRASPHRSSPADDPFPSSAKIFVVVEGVHDIAFLRRISTLLHASDSALRDLAALERQGLLVFVPFGGGDLLPWTYRLASLSQAEFHLYDREMPPLTEFRQQHATIVNSRPR